MKFNIKILSLISLILIATSMSVVFATEAKINSSTFEIPEGYTGNEIMGVMMLTDGKSAIMVMENASNISTSKQKLLNKGFTLTNETTYNFENNSNIVVKQENYKKDQSISLIYEFKKNDKNYLITYTLPEGVNIPSNENNPVTKIIQSLK